MTLSIIIVNWNTRDLLLQCVGSVLDCDLGDTCEIIVVDNASSDGSSEAIRRSFPQVKLMESQRNLGFGAGSNLGAAESNGDLLLFLNPDTIVPFDTLGRCVDFISEHEEVGLLGPELLGLDGRKQISSFGLSPSAREAWQHAIRIWRVAPGSRAARAFLVEPDEGMDWVKTTHILGACMLVRAGLFRELEGFDEGFFLFLEETDLCVRARSAGWQIVYYTGARVIHVGEQSMQSILHKTGGMYIRSYNQFCVKHGLGFAQRVLVNVALCGGVIVESLMGLAKYRSPRRAGDSLRALWYAYVVQP